MQLLRKAREDEVPVPETHHTWLEGAPYSVWEFSADDIESIVTRLPGTTYAAPLSDLLPMWKAYLAQPQHSLLASRYLRGIGALQRGGTLAQRPILYAAPRLGIACYIADGQEQLLAVLDFAARRKDFTIEVFWSDAGGHDIVTSVPLVSVGARYDATPSM
jgi:hypothetical protein